MTTTTELFTCIAMMFVAGVFLLLMLLKHFKKIALIAVALLIFLSYRAVKLGYAQFYANKARITLSETMENAMDEVEDAGRNLSIDEEVTLPDAEDVRGVYYYDTGRRGFGLPEKEGNNPNSPAKQLIEELSDK